MNVSVPIPAGLQHRIPDRLDWYTLRSLFGPLLLALMVLLLAWRTAAGALAVGGAGETSMILALPMWWVYGALAPGLALTGVIAVHQALVRLAGGNPVQEAA